MKKTLLIIGAGREQIPAYQIAKKMGLNVIGTDRNPNAPAFDFADKKLICSTRDANHTLETVLEFSKKKSINGVMTIANDVPFTVALVANTLSLPGISLQSARYASNKILMKNQFVKHGVPTPKSEILGNKKDFLKLVSKKSFPLILKPSDGRGGRGVLYLDKSVDLNWAWNFVFEISDNKELMLEEYIAGEQLSVEGIFIKKKFYPIAFADRNYENLAQTKPHIIEDGGVIPSKYEGKILKKISFLIEKASKSLNIDFGSVKADIVLSNGEPMIIELAARLSGNYLATHHIPMAYGTDLVSAVIKLSLGIEFDSSLVLPKHKKFLAVRYFFPKHGLLKNIQGIEKVKSKPFVKMLEIFHDVGSIQPKIAGHVDRAGTYDCNLRCDKCFALKWLNEENKRDYMSVDNIRDLWDQAYKLGAVHVNLTGGEPLLRRDIVDVVKALKPKRTLVSIVTTGIFLTEEKARELKEAGLNTFQISLDSSIAEEHDRYRGYKGSFEKVFRAVEIAKKVGINVILSTVITHQNVKTNAIPNMLKIAEKNDTFLLLNIAGRSGGWSKKDYLLVEKEEREKFVSEFGKHPRARMSQMFNFYGKPGICNMGKDKLCVSAYGEVYPCTYVALVFGRLRERSLKDIWDQMNEFKYFQGFSNSCRRVDDEEFAKKYIQKLAMHDKPYMNLEDVEAKIMEEEKSGKTVKFIKKLPVINDNSLLLSDEGNGCYTHGGCGSDCGCEE